MASPSQGWRVRADRSLSRRGSIATARSTSARWSAAPSRVRKPPILMLVRLHQPAMRVLISVAVPQCGETRLDPGQLGEVFAANLL